MIDQVRVDEIEAELLTLGEKRVALRDQQLALRAEADEFWKAKQQEIIDNPSTEGEAQTVG